jgi:hypothetical protein
MPKAEINEVIITQKLSHSKIPLPNMIYINELPHQFVVVQAQVA